MRKTFKLLVGVFLLAVIMGACTLRQINPNNVGSSDKATLSSDTIDLGLLRTQTLMATQKTETEFYTPIATTPGLPLEYTSTPTAVTTPKPTLTMTSETTLMPSFTPRPTNTLVQLPTRPAPTGTATLKPIPCDQAAFVKDLSVKDGSIFPPGTTFVKSWRLLNSGTCTWTTDYGIVFESGEKMSAQSPKLFGVEVKPGKTVDVSVTLTSPYVGGIYRGNWMLRNAKGEHFGTTGAKVSGQPFFVSINVKNTTTNYALDFVSNYCDAQWFSDAGNLTCPGSLGNPNGLIQRIDGPVLENGATDNEPALLMIPHAVTNGWIQGKYPWHTVVNGDTFRAVLGCAEDAKTCNVKFQLDYVLDGETTIRNLAAWDKTWDGTIKSVAFDLSFLAGKKVRFVLTVVANGETRDNRAMWLAPRIISK